MNNKKTDIFNDKWIIFILVVMTFQNITRFYIEYQGLSIVVSQAILFLALFLPLVLTLIKLRYVNIYELWFLIILICLVFLSINNFIINRAETFFDMAIFFQLLTGLLLKDKKLDFLLNIFRTFAYLAFAAILYIFLFIRLDVNVALIFGYQWSESFYYVVLFWAVIPFVVLSTLTGKYKKTSYFYWACSVFLNIMFLKRYILIDSLLLICVIFLIILSSNKKIKSFFKIAAPIVIIGFVAFSLWRGQLTQLFTAVFGRIENTSENMAEFDRWIETKNYFQSLTIIEFILGKGFGSIHYSLGKSATALHIGWSNFIFKGGIALLFIILIPYFKMANLFVNMKRNSLKTKFCLFVLLIYFVRLFYVSLMSLTPEMFLIGYCLFNIMLSKEKNE